MQTNARAGPAAPDDLPMGTIWKYPVAAQQLTVHEIPQGAKALHVGPDPDSVLCVWFLVAPQMPLEKRAIVLVATGGEVPIDAVDDYVGTFVVGSLVHHVFSPSPTQVQA